MIKSTINNSINIEIEQKQQVIRMMKMYLNTEEYNQEVDEYNTYGLMENEIKDLEEQLELFLIKHLSLNAEERKVYIEETEPQYITEEDKVVDKTSPVDTILNHIKGGGIIKTSHLEGIDKLIYTTITQKNTRFDIWKGGKKTVVYKKTTEGLLENLIKRVPTLKKKVLAL